MSLPFFNRKNLKSQGTPKPLRPQSDSGSNRPRNRKARLLLEVLEGRIVPTGADYFANAYAIPGGLTSLSDPTDNTTYTMEVGEPANTFGGSPRGSTWWKFQVAAGGSVTVDTTGTAYPLTTPKGDTTLEVFTGSSLATLTLVPGTANDDGGANSANWNSSATFTASTGTVYYVRVKGFDANSYGVTQFHYAGPTTVDLVPPTVTGIVRQTPAVSPTNASAVTFQVTFSEPVQNVDATDFVVGTGTITSPVTTVSSSVYNVEVTGLSAYEGTLGLGFAGGQNITDFSTLLNPLTNTTPTGVNESYVLDHLSPIVVVSSGNVPYTINTSAVAVDAGLLLTQGVDPTITGAVVSIAGFTNGDADVLNYPTQIGAITGSFNTTTGQLTLSGNDTAANYQTALRSITYFKNAYQATASRVINFQVTDNSAATGSGSRTIQIASSATWDGGAADGLWNSAANWVGDVLPGTGDVVLFNDTAAGGTITLSSAVTVASLLFTNTGSAFTLSPSGGSLILGAGLVTQSGTTSNTIAANMSTSAASFTFDIGAGTSLTESGNLSGSTSLVKNNTGTLIVSGTNTYTGATTVNAGSLKVVVITIGSPAIPAVPVGATGYYSFDNTSGSASGSTVFNDGSSGATNNGTFIGATQTAAAGGINGTKGMAEPTNGNYMQVPTPIPLTGGNWSGSAWFKNLYTVGDWRTLFRDNSTGNHQLIIQDSSRLLGLYNGGFVSSGYSVPASYETDNTWHHIAIVGSGTGGSSTTTFYIDGVQVGNTIVGNNSSSNIYAIGAYQGPSQSFAKFMDEVYVYNSTLTPAQITNLYNNGAQIAVVAASNPIPDGSAVTLAATGTLDLNGYAETIGSLTGSGTVSSTAAGASTLTTGANNTSTTFSGIFTDGAGVVGWAKSGTGTMTLDNVGTSTNTGPVTIQAGTVKIASADRLPVAANVTFGSSGVLDLNGFNQTVGSLSAISSAARVVNSAGGTPTLTINPTSGSTSFAGILGNTAQNSFHVVKTGAGTQALGGANTFTGALTVKAGTLSGTAATAFGPGTVTLGDSSGNAAATLDSGFVGTISNPISLASGNTGVASISASAAATLSGAVTLNGHDVNFTSTTANLTVSGAITGTANVTLNANGAGTIALTNANLNHTGTVTNSGSGAGTVTISSLVGTNVLGVVQNSPTSTLAFTTAVNTYTSGLTIKAGTVTGTLANSFGANANVITIGDSTGNANATLSGIGGVTYANPITVASGNTGVATITNAANVTFSGPITLNSHALTIASTGANTMTVSGAISSTGAGNNISLSSASTGVITLSNTVGGITSVGTITNAGAGSATNLISASINAGVVGIVQNSATSPLTLSGTNTNFGGSVTLSAGRLNLGSATALGGNGSATGTGGTFTIGAGTSLNTNGASLTLTTANAQVWNGDFTFIASNNLDFGTGAGAVTLGAASTITFTNNNTLTVRGAIGGNYGVGKSGTGSLSLNGINTYTGGMTLNAGTLNINNGGDATGSSLGTGTFTITGGTINSPNGLTVLTNNPQAWNGNFTVAQNINMGSGAITMSGNRSITVNTFVTFTNYGTFGNGGYTLTTAGNGAMQLLGNIGPDAGLLTANVGNLRLGGNNTNSAGVTVNAGAFLTILSANALGTGTLTINGGQLDAGNTNVAVATSNPQIWNGSFAVASNTLNLGNGPVTMTAPINVTVYDYVHFIVGSSSFTGNYPLTLVGSGIGTLTLAGNIGPGLGLVTVNNGTLRFSGSNTFASGVTINGGSLAIMSANALGTGTLTINGGQINSAGLTVNVATSNPQVWSGNFSVGTGNLNLGNGPVTMTAPINVTVFDYNNLTVGSSSFSGNFPLTLLGQGAGNFYLTGNLGSGLGLLTVNNGGLRLYGNNASFSSGITVNGGTLGFNNAYALGTGTLTMNGGNLHGGDQTFTVATNTPQIWNGSFSFNNGTVNMGTGPVTLTANTTFRVNDYSNLTVAGTISGANFNFSTGTSGGNGTLYLTGNINTGSGSVTSNNGQLVLSGNNTFSGGVILNPSTLYIHSPSALGTGTFTINGGTIDNSSGLPVVNSQNNPQAWNGNFTFNGSGASLLNLGTGAVTMNASRTVTVNNNGTLVVGGAIGESGAGYALTKAGNGVLTLGGANSFTGGVNFSAGTLNINNASALGVGGTFTIGAGATIDNTSGAAVVNSQVNPQNWNTNFTFTGSNPLDLGTGAVTMNATRTVTVSASALTVGGAIGGVGFGLVKAGNGTLVLNNASSNYNGSTTVNAGVLSVSTLANGGSNSSIGSSASTASNLVLNNGTLRYTGSTVATNRAFTITSGSTGTIDVSDAGTTLTMAGAAASTGALTKVGPGILILGSSNLYTGTTSVNNGGLTLDFSAVGAPTTNILSSSSPLTLGGGSITLQGNSGATNSQAFNGTTFSANTASSFSVIQNGATAINATLGGLTRNAGATVNFTLPSAGTISTTTNTSLGTNKVNTANGVAYATVGGTTWLTNGVSVAGQLGALSIYQTDAFAANLDTDITASNAPSAFSINTLRFNTAGQTLTLDSSGASTLTAGGILITSAGTGSVIASGGGSAALQAGTTGRELVIHNYADLTISAPIVDNGGAGLVTVTGTGITTLSGANTYTGATSVTAGTLKAGVLSVPGVSGALGKNSAVTIANAATAVLDLNTFNTQIGSLAGGGTTGGSVLLGGANLTIAGSATTTYAGSISGSGGALVQSGTGSQTVSGAISGSAAVAQNSGTLILSGVNTFTGGVTLNAGTLRVGSTTALGATASALAIAGGTLDTTAGITLVNNNPLTVNGDFIFSGTNNLNVGTGAATLGTTAGTSRTITANANTLTLGGAIANGTTATQLIKAGAGALSLAGANTFTGGVTQNAGTLNINNASALGTGTFAINGGTINNTSGAAITGNQNNALTLNGDFTFTGSSSLNFGTGAASLGAAAGTTRTITASANTLTIGGSIANGTTANSIVKLGNGALVLSGPINTGSGSVSVNAGTLVLSGANTFSGGANLNVGTLNVDNSAALGTGTFTIAGGTLNNTSGSTIVNSQNNPISWNGNFIYTGTSSLDLGTGAVTLNGNRTVLVSGNTLTLGGTISGSGFNLTKSGNGNLTVTGAINTGSGSLTVNAGVVTLGGSSSYTGVTAINGGTVSVATLANGGANSPLGASTSAAANLVLGGGSLQYTGTSVSTDRAFTLAAATTSTIEVVDPATNLTISGASATTAGSLTKTGLGILTLSGANTYTGTTTVNAGILKPGAASVPNVSGPFGNNAPMVVNATLDITGYDTQVGSLGGGGLSILGSNTLTVGGDNTNAYFYGINTGSGGLTKIGDGTQYLTGTNNYTGPTNVTSGQLALIGIVNVSNGGSLSSVTALSVASGAQFSYRPLGAGTQTVASLNLADGSTIGTNWGSTVNSSTTATVSGKIYLSMSGAFTSGTQYTVLTAAGGLNNATYVVLNDSNFTYTVTTTATSVKITPVTAPAVTNEYWLGGSSLGNVWSASNGSTFSNWTTDGNGTATSITPGATTTVNFSDISATAGNQIGMTLGADMTINSLIQNSVNPVSVNGGGSSLTLGGSTGGITLNSGTGGLTLNSNLNLGVAQSFTNNSSNPLSISGGVNNNTFLLTVAGSGNTSIAGPVIGTGGLTKTGAGALTLSGISNFQGNATVSGGTFNLNGTWNGIAQYTSPGIFYGGTAGTTIVNVSGSFNGYSTIGANVAGSVAVFNQTAGSVSVSAGNGQEQYVAANGGYGYFNLSGGTYTNANRFTLANGQTSSATAVGYISGTGTLNADNMLVGWGSANTIGQLTIAGGGTVNVIPALNSSSQLFHISNGTGANVQTVNVAGGSLNVPTVPIGFYGTAGMLNVAGGTLTTQGLIGGNSTTGYINLSGGTIKTVPTGPLSANLLIATGSTTTFNVTNFGAIDNSAVSGPSFAGGVTFDTNGFNQTVNTAVKGAVSSVGLTQANISIPGNSGYAGAPAVAFTVLSGGMVAGGTPAAGYALISGGSVTGIVITSPGTYTSGSTLTITFTGGGGTLTTISTSALTTANGAGGLTKTGSGVLLLSGANTYTGATNINVGSVQAGVASVANTSGPLGLNSAVSLANTSGVALDLNNFNTQIGSLTGGGTTGGNLTLGSAILTTGGDNTSPAAYAGAISGSGAVTKIGTGTQILSGNNSYAGATTISAGTLQAGSSNALGTTAAGTTIAAGATLAFSGNSAIGAEAVTLTPNASAGADSIVNVSGNNSLAGNVGQPASAGGYVGIRSTSGTLTIDGSMSLDHDIVTVSGAGNIVVNGSISGSSDPVSGYSSTVLATPGLTNYWRLNETSGTTAANSAGGPALTYSPAGVSYSQPSALAGDADTSISLNGSTGYATIPNSVFNYAGGTPSAAQTFETWFKTSSPGVILSVVSQGNIPGSSTPGSYVPALYIGADHKLRSSMFWHGSTANQVVSAASLDDGSWHHVAIVYNGTTESLFVDGVSVGTPQTVSQTSFSPYSFYLGAGFTAGGWPSAPSATWSFFNGTIDETAVYNAALSPATIANHYSTGISTVNQNFSLTKNDSGTLTLNGNNSFTGVTTVNGGTLSIGAGGSINATSSIVLVGGSLNYNSGTALTTPVTFTSTGSVLSGTGVINTPVAVTAFNTLAPGNSVGTLTIANNLDLSGVNDFEVTGGGVPADKVSGIGNLLYGGTLKITNVGGAFVSGDSWDLFDFTTFTGGSQFFNNSVFGTSGDGVNLPSLGGGLQWQFNYATGVLSVFSPVAAPTVTSIVPAIGPTTGGTMVLINGSNFISISSVTVAGTPLATFSVSGTTQISITMPVHAAGGVDVVVTNSGGSGSLVGASDFTYATPAIASVVVNGGPGVVLGGSTWSLAGQNSVVKQILVTFNQAVSLASDAFTVTPVPVSLTPGPGVVIVNGGAAPSTAAVTASISATLSPSSYLVTFSGPGTHAGGGINSGVYDLTTVASKVSANGETMASNRVDTFFAMFGTINANDSLTAGYIGDGFSNAFVDPGSLFQFSDAFGSSAATPVGPPAYNIVFDSNLDGFIDPGDLFAFSDAFGIDWDF